MDTTVSILVYLILFIASISTLLPVVPASVVALTGVILHKLWFGPDSLSWNWMIILTGLTLFAQILDLLLTWWGAKRFGASWQGALGALLGSLVGAVFFGLPGVLIGPIIGTVLFEWIQVRSLRRAGRAGFGTFVGGLLALIAKTAITFFIIGRFLYHQWI